MSNRCSLFFTLCIVIFELNYLATVPILNPLLTRTKSEDGYQNTVLSTPFGLGSVGLQLHDGKQVRSSQFDSDYQNFVQPNGNPTEECKPNTESAFHAAPINDYYRQPIGYLFIPQIPAGFHVKFHLGHDQHAYDCHHGFGQQQPQWQQTYPQQNYPQQVYPQQWYPQQSLPANQPDQGQVYPQQFYPQQPNYQTQQNAQIQPNLPKEPNLGQVNPLYMSSSEQPSEVPITKPTISTSYSTEESSVAAVDPNTTSLNEIAANIFGNGQTSTTTTSNSFAGSDTEGETTTASEQDTTGTLPIDIRFGVGIRASSETPRKPAQG